MILDGVLSAERDGHRPPFRIPQRLSVSTGLRLRKRRKPVDKTRQPVQSSTPPVS
jgi:hypothetical protein